jgi:hypothetical protein
MCVSKDTTPKAELEPHEIMTRKPRQREETKNV